MKTDRLYSSSLKPPIPSRNKKVQGSFEDSYTNDQLIEYLNFHGLMVKKVDDRLDVMTAIKILESRGYEVKGFLKSFLYKSPISEYNLN